MSVEETFGNSFKPEVKSSGLKLVSQEKISLTSHSDTQIQAYTRGTPPCKVSLNSDDISSKSFTAHCNCPLAKKDRFCKHIWATLLFTEEKYPDFLSAKQEINLQAHVEEAPSRHQAYQESAKLRASEYRKEQYQKQKNYSKEKKRVQPQYSAEVEAALSYFSVNGFPMPDGPSKEIMAEAKRKLSRVFHPDKGGSHEESVELNQNCEVLLVYFRS